MFYYYGVTCNYYQFNILFRINFKKLTSFILNFFLFCKIITKTLLINYARKANHDNYGSLKHPIFHMIYKVKIKLFNEALMGIMRP